MRRISVLCLAWLFVFSLAWPVRAADDVAVLVKQLKDKDEVVRLKAAKALGKLGAEAREALPDLFFAADDSDADVRAVAKQAIKNIQEAVKLADRTKALPMLEQNAKDAKSGDAKTRAAGVAGLAKQLQDSDPVIRLKAVQVLVELGPGAADALPALREASKSDDANVRQLAKRAVEALQTVAAKKGHSKVEPLIKDLKSKDKAARLKALETLAELGPEGKEAGQAVAEAMLDKSPAIASKADETLAKIDPDVHKLVSTITTEIDFAKRIRVIQDLDKMGSDGKSALPLLMLVGQDRRLAEPALRASVRVAPEDARVGDAVLKAIGEQNLNNPRLRGVALSVMESVSFPAEKADKAVKALMFALNANDPHIRADAVKMLGKIGPPAKEAVPALNKLKQDLSAEVRVAVVGALEKIQGK